MANPYRHRQVSADALLNMTNIECYARERMIREDLANNER